MSRPLRIAMFAGSFPVVSETFVVRQISGLLDLGHEVEVYADARAEPDSPVHPEVGKYRLLERATFMNMPPETAPWEMPVWPLTGRTWPPGSATSVLNSVRLARALPRFLFCLTKAPRLTFKVLRPSKYRYQAASLSALYRLAVLCSQSGKYDVLHAHFGPVGNSFRFAKELWRAPLIVSFHGYDFCTVPRTEGADVYRELFANVEAITVNSDFTRGQLEKLGCPAEKLRIIPVGLDPNEFPFRDRVPAAGDSVRILAVGRLVEIKGHEFLLRALAVVRAQHPNVRCDIVGDGPLRKKLEALSVELGVQSLVTFHGALDGTAVRRFMDGAHIFVLASVSVNGDEEGQGLVLQEAQACGLPVVATKHGGLPEGLVPDRSGFVIPERDPDALADRLSCLIRHPERWPDMGREGRRLVEARYDIHQLNRQLTGLYEEVIQLFRPTSRNRK